MATAKKGSKTIKVSKNSVKEIDFESQLSKNSPEKNHNESATFQDFVNESADSPGFSEMKPIFLQANKNNIYHYFASALITPAYYQKNRATNDSQSRYPSTLLLSNGLLESLDESQILIELILDPLEIDKDQIFGALFFLQRPVPISRIKKVYVASYDVKNDIISTALAAEAGVVPEYIITAGFPNLQLIIQDEKSPNSNVDYHSEVKKFDQFLGAFAFMRNVNLLYANNSKILSNYSDEYLGAAKLLLNQLEIPVVLPDKKITFFQHLIGDVSKSHNEILEWLIKRASEERNLGTDDIRIFGNLLLKNHHDEEYKRQGKEVLSLLDDPIKRKTAPELISKIQHADRVYITLFAALALYGNKSAEDRTNSRLGLPNEVPYTYSSLVFALLGYYYGYTLLRNFDDKQKYLLQDFQIIANQSGKPAIKFLLDSDFDYDLIEAAYSHAFKLNSSAQRLSKLHRNIKSEEVKINLGDDYILNTLVIRGRFFYRIQKVTLQYKIEKSLEDIPSRVPPMSQLGLFCYQNELTPYWGDLNTSTGLCLRNLLKENIYFSKNELHDWTKGQSESTLVKLLEILYVWPK